MSGQADKRDALSNAKSFFEDIWSQGDYWQLESSEFEDAKYKRQVELISDRRYGKALELGCASGVFTRMIAPFCDEVIALDISQNAIDRARSLTSGGLEQKITFLAENAMEYDLTKAGPWDLVTLCETICYLGWLYPFFDVAWMITRIYNAIRPGGRLLMTNTLGLD